MDIDYEMSDEAGRLAEGEMSNVAITRYDVVPSRDGHGYSMDENPHGSVMLTDDVVKTIAALEQRLSDGAAREAQLVGALRVLSDLAQDHQMRYSAKDREDYWRGRRDEAGWLGDQIRAALAVVPPGTQGQE